MFGTIILVGNILAETFNSLFQRYIAKNHHNHKFSAFFIVQLLFFYPTGLLYSFFHRDQTNFSLLVKQDWKYLLLIGVSAGITYRFIMTVNNKVEASTQQIVGTLRTVGILVIAALFLSEHLAMHQYIGAAILIVSSVLYIRAKHLSDNFRYILLHASITLIFCACLVTEKYLISKYGLATYLPLGWGAEIVFLCLFTSKKFTMRLKQMLFQDLPINYS